MFQIISQSAPETSNWVCRSGDANGTAASASDVYATAHVMATGHIVDITESRTTTIAPNGPAPNVTATAPIA